MASHPRSTAGAANFARRTWDKAEYEAKAKERAEAEAAGGELEDGTKKREPAPYRPAPPGAARPPGSQRSYLKAREHEVDLDSRLHQKRLITAETPLSQTGGYWCDLCQCTLSDSSSWLSHLNGIKHQRRLGMSMRVEKATVDAVKERLAKLKGGGGAAKPSGPVMDVEDRYAMAAMGMATHAAPSHAPHPPSSTSASVDGVQSIVGHVRPRPSSEHGEGVAAATGAPSDATVPGSVGEGHGPEGQAHTHAAKRFRHDHDEPACTRSTVTGEEGDGGSCSVGEGDGDLDEEAVAAMMGFGSFGGSGKRR